MKLRDFLNEMELSLITRGTDKLERKLSGITLPDSSKDTHPNNLDIGTTQSEILEFGGIGDLYSH